MKKAKIYAAWCGTGKTYICEKTNLKSIEIEYWRYKEKGEQDKYIEDVKKYINEFDYLFISTDPEGLKILNEVGLKITIVYPENSLREEYLDRYLERNSPADFIGVFMKYWDSWLNELKKLKYCNHIVLKKGQYLKDILDNQG